MFEAYLDTMLVLLHPLASVSAGLANFPWVRFYGMWAIRVHMKLSASYGVSTLVPPLFFVIYFLQ